MLTPRHLALAGAVVALIAIGWGFLAFCIVAGYAAGRIAKARRGACPVDDQPADSRPGVDLDKAIGAIERIARIGATTGRRSRTKRS